MKLFVFLIAYSFGLLFSFSQNLEQARKDIDFLTSEKCRGRGYTFNGVENASAYLTKRFKQIGLKPLCKKRYDQKFTMPVNTFAGKMDVSVNGKKLIPGVHFIVNDDSPGITGGFTLMKSDSVTWLAFDARNQAALAFQLKKKLTWSVSQKKGDFTVVELLKDSFPEEPKSAEVWIESKFIDKYPLANIIGYVKGTRRPDSFIVFSAHYDHLGTMGKSTFFPGANDNSSGVSMLLQLAEYYAKNPQPYSVAFFLFAGEEAGLVGSKHFTEKPVFPLLNIRFLLNLDLLGTGEEGITVVNSTVFTPEFERLKKINDDKSLLKQLKPRGKAANSDHYWFTEKGVRLRKRKASYY